jgi:alkylation response protein AidB-like acyl-CoA dehydrogenase
MSAAGIETIEHPSTAQERLMHETVHQIRSDQEAIQTAHQMAEQFEKEASERDHHRRLPYAEIELLSTSGLWGISIPKAFGGPGSIPYHR